MRRAILVVVVLLALVGGAWARGVITNVRAGAVAPAAATCRPTVVNTSNTLVNTSNTLVLSCS